LTSSSSELHLVRTKRRNAGSSGCLRCLEIARRRLGHTFARVIAIDSVNLSTRARGVVLCADLVGNATPCVEYLDAVHAAVLRALAASDGRVIGVSRDTITCWFDGDDGLAAIACGLRIVEAVGDVAALPALAGTAPLATKVLIVCSTDPTRVTRARELASAGDVVADADVVAGAADRLLVIGWLAHGGDQFAVVGRLRGGPPDRARAVSETNADTIASLARARNRRVTGASGDVVSWFVAGRARASHHDA